MLDRELRRLRLGASEAAAVAGLDEFRTPADVVIGKRFGFDLPQTRRQEWGKFLEEAILRAYGQKTGRRYRYVDQTRASEKYQFLACTPDALCEDIPVGVDAKLVAWDQRGKWGETVEDIPFRIRCQAHVYCAEFDCEAWDIAALFGTDTFRIYTVERDRETEAILLDLMEGFWRRYIIGDEFPPIGGSQLATEWLKQQFPEHKRPDLRPATEREIVLLGQLACVHNDQKELKEARAQLENTLKLHIGEREGLEWPSGRLTWRKCKDSKVTDWESIARGLLNAQPPDIRATLLGLHTRVKPGTRRLHLRSTWLDADPDETELVEEVHAG